MYRGSSRAPKLRIQMTGFRDQGSDGSSTGAKSFEDLVVFQRAYRLSLEVHRISLTFPDREQMGLGDQMRRSSKSVCANIVEGFGRQRRSGAEFARFVTIAIGSADEMRLWCRYCLDLGYVDEETWQRWRDGYQEIARMLQGLRTSLTSDP